MTVPIRLACLPKLRLFVKPINIQWRSGTNYDAIRHFNYFLQFPGPSWLLHPNISPSIVFKCPRNVQTSALSHRLGTATKVSSSSSVFRVIQETDIANCTQPFKITASIKSACCLDEHWGQSSFRAYQFQIYITPSTSADPYKICTYMPKQDTQDRRVAAPARRTSDDTRGFVFIGEICSYPEHYFQGRCNKFLSPQQK